MSSTKTVIIIAGPTASGKTDLAIRMAAHYGTEIISADSKQCYKELSIGVGRPSELQLSQVPHWFVASHSIHDKVTAATFEKYALEKTEQLFQSHDTVIMAGGTGLYIRAFTDGMHEIPEVPSHIMDDIVQQYYEYGLNWLQKEIETLDPAFFEKGERQNPHRLMRALGVIRATGRSVFDYRTGEKVDRPFAVKKIAVDLPREALKENINSRVDQMMAAGLLDEARELLPFQHLNALQTVGYKEMFSYLKGDISLPEAVAAVKLRTRQYAKRQLTWFRNDPVYQWLSAEQAARAFAL